MKSWECGNITHVVATRDEVQQRVGQRVGAARESAGLTQTALAEQAGMERTQLVRVENGERKVTVRELAAIAAELGVPIDWFISEAPPAVVSRRRDAAPGHATSRSLDIAIDRAARDVEFLVGLGCLEGTSEPIASVPSSHQQAEDLARRLRERLSLADGPIDDLGAAAENAGLIWFAEDLGAGDGACIEVETTDGRLGVAVVNGRGEPGRRRWTLAHELGHFLVGDAYAGEHPGGEVEKYIDSFVAHLLMPRSGVHRVWDELHDQGARRVALAVSARFQTSWSAACGHLTTLHHIDDAQRRQLLDTPPRHGDYLATGESWSVDLVPPAVPPRYGRSVVLAYVAGELSADRSIELLRSTIGPDDLPERPDDTPYPSLPSA